jgi:hypothetical protein
MVRSSTRKITTSGTMPQRVCREHVPEVNKHSGLFEGQHAAYDKVHKDRLCRGWVP